MVCYRFCSCVPLPSFSSIFKMVFVVLPMFAALTLVLNGLLLTSKPRHIKPRHIKPVIVRYNAAEGRWIRENAPEDGEEEEMEEVHTTTESTYQVNESDCVQQEVEIPSRLEPITAVNPNCKRKDDVFYLKIHKTGSSTLTSLFYRYALRHNIPMILTNVNPHMRTIEEMLMHPPPGVERVHGRIFADHYHYQHAEIKRILPGAVKLASLRYPLEHMRAVMVEFGLMKKFEYGDPDPVRTYLSDITRWGRYGLGGTKSLQMEELGVRRKYLDNLDIVRKRIRNVEQTFDQVLIAEYFDESLVMTRRKLCWETEDIVYMALRVRKYKHKSKILDPHLVQVHRNFSAADYLLYDHFTGVLLRQMQEEQFFWEELRQFKMILNQLEEFCRPVYSKILKNPTFVDAMVKRDVHINIDPRPWGKPFSVSELQCALMRLDTVILRNCMKVLQYPQLCTSPAVNRTYSSLPVTPLFDIRWIPADSDNLDIQPIYCQPIDPQIKVTLEILKRRHVYMGLKG